MHRREERRARRPNNEDLEEEKWGKSRVQEPGRHDRRARRRREWKEVHGPAFTFKIPATIGRLCVIGDSQPSLKRKASGQDEMPFVV